MSTASSGKHGDRRIHPRIPTDLTGTLSCDGETQCKVLNVSRSGAFAVSPKALPEMSHVQIRLQIALDGEPKKSLLCEAAVVRCDLRADGKYDVGLFFTSLAPGDQELLQAIIDAQTIPSSI